MSENTRAGAAAIIAGAAEKSRMGMPVMAPGSPGAELERLRALLGEALKVLRNSDPAPGTIAYSVAAFIAAELKVEPAPLPYSVEGRMIICARSLAIATVDGPEGEREATAEFIARACSSFPELVRVAREGLRYAQYLDALSVYTSGLQSSPPAPAMPYDQDLAAAVIEAATGERP